MSRGNNPEGGIVGVGGIGGLSRVRAPDSAGTDDVKPGTLSIFDSDMEGAPCPEGFAQFKGDGKTTPTQLTGRVMELAEMGQFAPVVGDAARWVAKRNNLNEDPSHPIPMNRDVGIPINELKSLLRMLEPKLKSANQQFLGSQTTTMTDGQGVQRTIGNVPSLGFRTLPDE